MYHFDQRKHTARIETEITSMDKKIGTFIEKVTKLEKTESQEAIKLQQVTQDEKEASDLLQETEEMVCLQ